MEQGRQRAKQRRVMADSKPEGMAGQRAGQRGGGQRAGQQTEKGKAFPKEGEGQNITSRYSLGSKSGLEDRACPTFTKLSKYCKKSIVRY